MLREDFVIALRELGFTHYKLSKIGFAWGLEVKHITGVQHWYSDPYLQHLFQEALIDLTEKHQVEPVSDYD